MSLKWVIMQNISLITFETIRFIPKNQQQNSYQGFIIRSHRKATPKKEYLRASISNPIPLKAYHCLL